MFWLCHFQENITGCFDFSQWGKVGHEFLVKSNINDWITCYPEGGSILDLIQGPIVCNRTKIVVPDPLGCTRVLPYQLRVFNNRPALFATDFWFYFDTWSSCCWPCSDPCGLRQQNHVTSVAHPMGQLYLRQYELPREEVNFVYKSGTTGNSMVIKDTSYAWSPK